MKINIKDCYVYYINPSSFNKRTEMIENVAKSIGGKEAIRVSYDDKFIDRTITISMAHITTLIKAYERGHYPLIILEDDCEFIKPLPEFFDLPDECHILYLGGSTYDCPEKEQFKYIEYNKDFYRVLNMLSTHAMLIQDRKGTETILRTYISAMLNRKFNDIALAHESNNSLFLAPKEGMYLYQNDYTKDVTHFEFK